MDYINKRVKELLNFVENLAKNEEGKDRKIQEVKDKLKEFKSAQKEEQIALLYTEVNYPCCHDKSLFCRQVTGAIAKLFEIANFEPNTQSTDQIFIIPKIKTYAALCDYHLTARNVTKALKYLTAIKNWREANQDVNPRLNWRLLNCQARFQSLNNNFDIAHQLHLEAQRLALEYGNEELIKNSLFYLAVSLTEQYKYSQAQEQLNNLLKMLSPNKDSDKHHYLQAFNQLGFMYFRQGLYDLALVFYEKKLQLLQKSGQKEAMIGCYSDIGLIHQKKGYLNKAKNCYTRDLTLSDEANDDFGSARALANVGSIYIMQKKFVEAEKCFLRSSSISKKMGDHNLFHNGVINLANIAASTGLYDAAIDYLLKEHKYCTERNMFNEVLQIEEHLISIYFQRTDYNKSLELISQSLLLAKKIKNLDAIVQILFIKLKIFLKEKNHQSSGQIIGQISEYLSKINNKKYHAMLLFYQGDLAYQMQDYASAINFISLCENSSIEIGLENLIFKTRIFTSRIRIELDRTLETTVKEKEKLLSMVDAFGREERAEIYYNLIKIEKIIHKLSQNENHEELSNLIKNCQKTYNHLAKNGRTYKINYRLKKLEEMLITS